MIITGIYLIVAICMLAITAVFVVLAFVVGMFTHPIRTLALVINRISAIAGGLATLNAAAMWFLYDHTAKDFAPLFWASIGIIVLAVILIPLTQYIMDRPSHAEQQAAEQARIQQELALEQRIRERVAWEMQQHRPDPQA